MTENPKQSNEGNIMNKLCDSVIKYMKKNLIKVIEQTPR